MVDDYRKARTRQQENKAYDPKDLRKGFELYKENFTVPQDMFDMLMAKAKDEKITYTDSAYQATLPLLKVQLKALIARDLWDMSEYFEIFNPSNEIYLQGLKALKDDNLFEFITSQ